jgi:hypothetical protein
MDVNPEEQITLKIVIFRSRNLILLKKGNVLVILFDCFNYIEQIEKCEQTFTKKSHTYHVNLHDNSRNLVSKVLFGFVSQRLTARASELQTRSR